MMMTAMPTMTMMMVAFCQLSVLARQNLPQQAGAPALHVPDTLFITMELIYMISSLNPASMYMLLQSSPRPHFRIMLCFSCFRGACSAPVSGGARCRCRQGLSVSYTDSKPQCSRSALSLPRSIKSLSAMLNPEEDVYDSNGYTTNKHWVKGCSPGPGDR